MISSDDRSNLCVLDEAQEDAVKADSEASNEAIEKIIDEIINKIPFNAHMNLCLKCLKINNLCTYLQCFYLKTNEKLESKYLKVLEEDRKVKEYNKNNSNIKLVKFFRKNSPREHKPIIEIGTFDDEGIEIEDDDHRFVNIACINPTGLKGKVKAVENICNVNNIKVMICSETHCSGSQIPFLSRNFASFHRNRNVVKASSKGGVCIFVHRSMSDHAIILDKGEDEEEWIAVKLTNFNPAIVIMAVYGKQENGPKQEIEDRWMKIFSHAERYRSYGSRVIIGGDLNIKMGLLQGMKRNDEDVSVGGRVVDDLMTKGGWFLANSIMEGDQRSHIDRSGGKSRCLDYIIVSDEEMVKEAVIDNDMEATPFRVLMARGKACARKFTDHKSIMIRVGMRRKKNLKEDKPGVRFIKDDNSIAQFKVLTNDIARKVLPDVIRKKGKLTTIINKVKRLTKKAKYKAHRVLRPSRRRAKILEDEDIFFHETKNLERELENLEKMKINNKIWRTRKHNILKERGQECFSMIDENGNLCEDKESVIDLNLRYNSKLLGREHHPPQFQELFKLKKQLMEMVTEANIINYDTVTEYEYIKVVKKVCFNKKNMFMDFIESGVEYKVMIFHILKRVYEEEDIPESFHVTVLQALYKKGNPQLAENYRFLHLREMLARLLEQLIYQKLEVTYDEETTEEQCGGMKESDCSEHLCLLMSMVQECVIEEEACVLTFMDIKKCFDMTTLSDMNYMLMLKDVDIKALKMFQLLTGKNIIKMQGGDGMVHIWNGEGQGGVLAARSCSGGIAQVFRKNFDTHPIPVILKNVEVNHSLFVDDAMTLDKTAMGASFSGDIVTASLDEISLRAHEKKTVQVICGEEKAVKKLKEDLQSLPTKIQGWQVQLAGDGGEKYLGMTIKSGNVKDIIEENIKQKRKKTFPIIQKVRKLVRDPKIRRIGSLKAACMLVQSQLIPVLLYGTESWLHMTKDQYSKMENIMKSAITTILSLPKSTPYESLLYETSQYFIENWLDLTKLKYFNKKLWHKEKGRLFRMLRSDIINNVKSGFVGDIELLCRKYCLPNILHHPLDPEDIKQAVQRNSRHRVWWGIMTTRKIPLVLNSAKIRHEHYEFLPLKARAITLYNTGSLLYKASNPHMIPKKYMANDNDRTCLHGCLQADSYEHCRFTCPHYNTKYVEDKDKSNVENNAEYIIKLHSERLARFDFPLILTSTWT